MRQSPLHCVIHFPRWGLLWRLVGFLLHLSLRLKEYRAVFRVAIAIVAMVHAIQKVECEWASATTVGSAWRAPSLAVLV
jgi:hypothetical protein